MQHNVRPVIWILGSDDRKIMEINGNGDSVTFGEEIIRESYNHDIFSLFDMQHDIMYSIDLNNGEIIINGVPICPSKEVNGRLLPISGMNVDYRAGLTQFKECIPIEVFVDKDIKPMTFNMGYKIDLSQCKMVYNTDSYQSQVIRAMVLLSIHIRDMKPRMSITITEKRTLKNGEEVMVKV